MPYSYAPAHYNFARLADLGSDLDQAIVALQPGPAIAGCVGVITGERLNGRHGPHCTSALCDKPHTNLGEIEKMQIHLHRGVARSPN